MLRNGSLRRSKPWSAAQWLRSVQYVGCDGGPPPRGAAWGTCHKPPSGCGGEPRAHHDLSASQHCRDGISEARDPCSQGTAQMARHQRVGLKCIAPRLSSLIIPEAMPPFSLPNWLLRHGDGLRLGLHTAKG
ncbi:hypothetical protein WJX73_004267 [Symbiochloris irregularis]|uniref:Uncharacterized protein n=1 Tax=Symbiochloris irregularis TaxID=706552 RepID=A0AAW1NNR8_9CHLO